MSIDSNLGMMLFSGDLSCAQTVGSLQGIANGTASAPEGSVFQLLLSQLLAGKTVPTDVTGIGVTSGAGNNSDGTGDPLSVLLIGNGNLGKVRLQNIYNAVGGLTETKSQSGESKPVSESGDAMLVLQAMMAGLTGTVPAANLEKILTEIQNGTSAGASAVSVIGSVMPGTGNAGIQGNQQFIQNSVLTGSNPQEAAVSEKVTAVQNGNQVLTETVPVLQAGNEVQMKSAELGVSKNAAVSIEPAELAESIKSAGTAAAEVSAGSKEISLPEPEKSDLMTGMESKTVKPEALSQQEMKVTQPVSDQQIALTGTRIQDELAAPAEKPKQENETADSMDPNKIGLQNPVQGAVTTSKTAELNPQVQQTQASEPYSQVRDEILAKLEQNGPTEFKMQLEPEDLGQIDIKLKLSEGKLIIDILAANSKTQALLTSQVDKLISSMGLQNVQVESVQVSQQMNSQTQDNSQSQGYNMNAAMDFSQRRQQEQYRPDIFQNNANLTATFSLQQDETKADSPVNRIESIRYDSHRMNYAV